MARATREPKHILRRKNQARFLATVAEVAPAVLNSLRQEVLPLYQQVFRSSDTTDLDEPPPEPGTYFVPLYKETLSVEDALAEWQTEFNLGADWVRRCARNTLSLWAANPDLRENWFAGDWMYEAPLDPFADYDGDFQLVFEHAGWDPRFVTWDDAKTEIKSRFDEYLANYKARIEEWAAAKGCDFEALQIKPKHIEWTVHRYVNNQPISEIAVNETERSYPDDPTEGSIRERIRTVARLIELPPL